MEVGRKRKRKEKSVRERKRERKKDRKNTEAGMIHCYSLTVLSPIYKYVHSRIFLYRIQIRRRM